jgi:hypothetical protein
MAIFNRSRFAAPSALAVITLLACPTVALAGPAFVAGTPPLTRQMTDAYAELLGFMIGQVTRGVAATPTPSDRAYVARTLAATYASRTAEERQQLRSIPSTWAKLRRTWPRLSQAQQATLRQQWAVQLGLSAPRSRFPGRRVRDGADDSSEQFAEESGRLMQDRLNNQWLSNSIGQQHSSVIRR